MSPARPPEGARTAVRHPGAISPAGGHAWPRLIAAASAPYRRTSRFAWIFARNKLAFDPVFRHLLQTGLIPPSARVLDIGCGQGLLASLLHGSAQAAVLGHWPGDWAPAPVATKVTGIEMMPRDVRRASDALGEAARFICGDMRHTPFPDSDVVVLLDVMHYIDASAQDDLLVRVRRALPVGGSLLMRVADAGSRRGLFASQAVDRIVAFFRGHRVTPNFCRTQAAWRAPLEALGFEVCSQPMSQGTPFANVLLVARVKLAATD